MNEVQPIKSIRDINKMKKALHGRDRLLFIIGINTTLRISDILSLKYSDIQGDYIILKEKKTGKSKRIRINSAIKSALPRRAYNSEEWLFPSRKGNGPISRVQAWRILKDAANRAALNIDIGTHSMRKTAAYHAYKNGTDISLLMRVLNHGSQRETLRYIGIESEQIDDVYLDLCL